MFFRDPMKIKRLASVAIKSFHTLPKSMQSFNTSYKNNRMELERLKRIPAIKNRLDQISYFYNNADNSHLDLTVDHEVALGKAFELQEYIKDDHFVFLHGQSKAFLAFNIFTKLFVQWETKKTLSPFETILRHPIDLTPNDKELLWYKKNLTHENLHNEIYSDHIFTNSLVSTDGYLANIEQSESYLSFFLCESHRRADLAEQAIKKIADKHIHDGKIRDEFLQQFHELNSEIAKKHFGCLYAICISKDYFSECGYLSEPFGVAANLGTEDALCILDIMQKTITTNKSKNCPNEGFYQVRLLTHKLNCDKVKVFLFPSMIDHELEQINQKVKDFFEQYKPYLNTEHARSYAAYSSSS